MELKPVQFGGNNAVCAQFAALDIHTLILAFSARYKAVNRLVEASTLVGRLNRLTRHAVDRVNELALQPVGHLVRSLFIIALAVNVPELLDDLIHVKECLELVKE